jgi:hypothetical protein
MVVRGLGVRGFGGVLGWLTSWNFDEERPTKNDEP